MAYTSMSYDHPVYTTPIVYSGSTTVGANGTTDKFCAFADMKIKQVVSCPNLALVTTAAGSRPLLYSQTANTTNTATLAVLTSASYGASIDDFADITITRGSTFWYTHGTDASTSRSVAIECHLVPYADVSAP